MTREREARRELLAISKEMRRLQIRLDAVWDDVEQRKAVWAELQPLGRQHDDLSRELLSIINFNSSSDEDRAALLDTDRGTLLRNGPTSGTSLAGPAPHDRDLDGASSVGPGTCLAIKKDGQRCSIPASKSGRYAGELCRLHATEAGKAEKRSTSRPIVKINPFTGEKSSDPGVWTCPQCGKGEGGSTSDDESDGRLKVVHGPANLRTCHLCDSKVVHVKQYAVAFDNGIPVLLSDCRSSGVHVEPGPSYWDKGRLHPSPQPDHTDGSPCFWQNLSRYITACHPDWETMCHERAGRAFGRLYS